MTHVTQIAGVPGGGKTYTLRQRLEAAAADGLDLHEFYWLNFTNSGRRDVEPVIRDVFAGTDGEPRKRAKTFHGLALSLAIRAGAIEPNANQIIANPRDEAYTTFCERQGMTYDPAHSDPRKLLDGSVDSTPTGNRLFAINDYLTQTCKSPERWQEAPVDIPTPGSRVVSLLEAWDRFKRTHYDRRRFEHGDYVKLAVGRGLYPSVELLLIDEFQDLAPLEYRLYKQWRDRGSIGRIYIAGDPNQSIYSFRGGTPYYFEETDTDERTDLTESRRCPKAVAQLGNAVLAAHPHTAPSGFTGREDGGIGRWRGIRDKYGLRDELIAATERYATETPAVMLLTRTNHQLQRLARDLRSVGIPFEFLGTRGGVWQGDMGQLLAFLNNVDAGGATFAWPNVRTVLAALPNGDDYRSAMAQPFGGIVDRDGVTPLLDGFEDTADLVEHLELKAWKRAVLANAIEAPAYLTPAEVRIGTIHTAKGLEAPAVYLFTSTSDRTVREYARDPEAAAEEHRVYYVGLTRASEAVYLVDGYFDGPTAPPIEQLQARAVAT